MNVFAQPVGHDVGGVLHQLVRAGRHPLRDVGDVGRVRARDDVSAREHLLARAGIVVDELGAEEIHRGYGRAGVDVGRDVAGDLDRDPHALHALERDARHPALLHARDQHGIALLQSGDALEHEVNGDAARAQRLSRQPEHADEEDREADQYDRPDPDFLLVREVH